MDIRIELTRLTRDQKSFEALIRRLASRLQAKYSTLSPEDCDDVIFDILEGIQKGNVLSSKPSEEIERVLGMEETKPIHLVEGYLWTAVWRQALKLKEVKLRSKKAAEEFALQDDGKSTEDAVEFFFTVKDLEEELTPAEYKLLQDFSRFLDVNEELLLIGRQRLPYSAYGRFIGKTGEFVRQKFRRIRVKLEKLKDKLKKKLQRRRG